MSIDELLAGRAARTTLGAQADRVVKVLAQMPQFASYASAREVAERAGVNVSTVVRTAQQLGFEGWTDLRLAIRQRYLASLATAGSERHASADPAAQMLRQDATNLAVASSPANIAAIKKVTESMNAARRIIVISTGSGAGPAQILSYLASILGYDIRSAVGPATEQASAVAQLDEKDCLIVLNVWRLTRALRGLTRLGRERGATVVVLTDLHSSPLNDDADHVLIAPIEGVGMSPSLTAMVAIVQAILAELGNAGVHSSFGRVERAWEDLGLLDDQP